MEFNCNMEKELWVKCKCGDIIYNQDLVENFKICPKCGEYFAMTAWERLAQLLDEGSFSPFGEEVTSCDPLDFGEEYLLKLREDSTKTSLTEAIIVGEGTLNDMPLIVGVMDFHFRGGSMGSVVGERVTLAIEKAVEKRLPLLIVATSGGARMQEGILSLMQMAKTSLAVARLNEARLPYISILTNPTTAGVAASYASLADILIAEPKALIGFAGPRVIEQTIRQKLPPGFQRSEFFLSHGMIDMIVERPKLKETVYQLFSILLHK